MTRLAISKIGCAVVMLATPSVLAAPVFWLSDSATPGSPGLLDLTVEPNSTGQLHIWADTDARLVSISLNLLQTGGALRFVGATIHNPPVRWTYHAAPTITDSAVTSLDAAISGVGLAGDGIGPGTPDGPTVLFATIDYLTTNVCCDSSLALQVGANTITDRDGNFVDVHFGTATSPLIPGYPAGGTAVVGFVQLIPEPDAFLLAWFAIFPFASSRRCRARRNLHDCIVEEEL